MWEIAPGKIADQMLSEVWVTGSAEVNYAEDAAAVLVGLQQIIWKTHQLRRQMEE